MKTPLHWRLTFPFALAALLAACGSDDSSTPAPDDDAGDTSGGDSTPDPDGTPDPDVTPGPDTDVGPGPDVIPDVPPDNDVMPDVPDGETSEECTPTGTACDEDASAVFCDGDTIIACSIDNDGCAVATQTDCAATGATCGENESGDFACLGGDPGDDCPVDACTAASYCIGDQLVICEEDADGCLIEQTRVACDAAGDTCVEDGDEAFCFTPEPEFCDASLGMIACGETVSGNTADGSRVIDDYACTPASYAAAEAIYGLQLDARYEVRIQTSSPTTGLDFDLMVLEGDRECDAEAPCVGSSRLGGAAETVTFIGDAGDRYWVSFDLFGVGSSDPNRTGEYSISVTCTPLVCGDGIRATGEGCDDGNTEPGDGCSATCQIEEGFTCRQEDGLSICRQLRVCGDGIIDAPETCDDGNNEPGDGCSDTCQREDGFLCSQVEGITVCRELNVCGDGFIDDDEECDDANDEPGDGCSDTCQIEDDYLCTGLPSDCRLIGCGDGVIQEDLGEECDDRNTEDGDGCSAFCTVEEDWICEGQPSDCYIPGCGDGRIQPDLGETCDDGNETAGDGCSDICEIEDGFFCFGAPSTCSEPIPLPTEVDGVLTFSSALVESGARWARPSATCTGATTSQPAYEIYGFINTLDVGVTIRVDAAWTFDGFLHRYNRPMDPATPLAGCVVGNDDFGGTSGSRLDNQFVGPGETIFIVASGFGATSLGTYGLNVSVLGIATPAEAIDVIELNDEDMEYVRTGELTDDSPRFARPSAICTGGTANVPFDMYEVRNPSTEDVVISVLGEWPFDGFLHVYNAPLIPLVSTVGCVRGNDDFEGTAQSFLGNITVPAGGSVWVVASTFGAAARGEYTLTVQIPPPIDEGDFRIEVEPGFTAVTRGFTTTGAPVAPRVDSTCAISTFAGAPAYTVFEVENTSATPVAVRATANYSGWDGYLVLYSAPFDPANPTAGCVTANDDFGGTAASRLANVNVPASSSVYFVITGFDDFEEGSGTFTIDPQP